MQVGTDIDNESGGYSLTGVDTQGMQVGIDIGNETGRIFGGYR